MFDKKTNNKEEVLSALALFNQKIDYLKQAYEKSTAANEADHAKLQSSLFGSEGTGGLSARVVALEGNSHNSTKKITTLEGKVDGRRGLISRTARVETVQKWWHRGFVGAHLLQITSLVYKAFGSIG
ncbi:hypothetical protein LCGC14_0614150 [marine sediment metagenome]|uniref:Uncharacterized protein n=1 Tax=marine sediment metagenome TaxID=412755 RepID=A0A0F9RBQ4_9ZZZZ